jgi:methionyl-tRNA formyltransferase
MKLRVLLASSSNLALPLLRELERDPRIELLGVLSTPDKPKGRHGTPSPNELGLSLQSLGVPLWKPVTESELEGLIRSIAPDLVIVIAYGKLIKRSLIDSVPRGWINLHFSNLPSYRGAAPVQRALLHGEKDFGYSFFQIDEGMDTGPVYLQGGFMPEETSPATEILDELAARGASSLPEVISMILSGEKPVKQRGVSSLAPKISKEELRLESGIGVEGMLRQIRAFTRKPGVWFELSGRRCIITSARRSGDIRASASISFIEGRALVGCGDGSIEILRIKPEGKSEMSGADWLRGLHLSPGDFRTMDPVL